MTAPAWPPPAAEDSVYRLHPVRAGDYEEREQSLRQVQLWGRPEWVDEHGRVWCVGCWHLFTIEELTRRGSPHHPSPSRGTPLHNPPPRDLDAEDD